ncbi:MAG TPA: hypothetical protein VMD04_02655 [Candidatus Margulisiibacteriota bacterium]|nr:hypothetical protein [Candidatus Margulisiibacteriota bacterium]
MRRIAFLQCQIVKEFPHMNMPLFVNDIKALGCDCECVCASRSKLGDLIGYLKKKKFDLFAVDYIFPVVFLNELKALFPKSKFVIGGNGFLDTFVKSRLDFAVIGAGRRSFLRLVEGLKNKTEISEIPNLFFRTKKNNRTIIDYSGKNESFDLKKELFPYRPFLKWEYVGFASKDKITDPPAIIAEFGCPYRSRTLNDAYDDLPDVTPGKAAFSTKAKKRIRELFAERMSGGCSFCTCPGTHVFLPVKETVDCLIEQVKFLQETYGCKSFVIGSENPFRFIEKLIQQMLEKHIKMEILALRSRVDWVNKNKSILFKIVGLAKKHDFRISLQQLGFESIIQSDLDIYNKGYKVSENFKAVELMRKLRNIAPKNFQDGGHGFIGINPWITMADLKKYLRSAGNMQFLFDSFHFGNGLILYDSCLPIYQKLKKDGLLTENKDDLEGWRFKDKNVVRFINDFYTQDSKLR